MTPTRLTTSDDLKATGVNPCVGRPTSAAARVDTRGSNASARPTFGIRHSTLPSGFTLTEMLVVIGVMVLLIGLAVPAFRSLSGSNSIEGASNVVSASLARARAQALGLQRPHGIAFYRDAATGRYAMALVEAKSPAQWTADTTYAVGDWVYTGPSTSRAHFVCIVAHTSAVGTPPPGANWETVHATANTAINAGDLAIDLVAGSDRLLLPTGVDAATVSDTYRDLGVVLFDANGAVVSSQYTIAFESRLYQQVVPGATGATTFVDQVSQIGLMLFDRELAANAATRAIYIQDNATPLLVNRYNGTIVKGE